MGINRRQLERDEARAREEKRRRQEEARQVEIAEAREGMFYARKHLAALLKTYGIEHTSA